jgi:hypothetical protein
MIHALLPAACLETVQLSLQPLTQLAATLLGFLD